MTRWAGVGAGQEQARAPAGARPGTGVAGVAPGAAVAAAAAAAADEAVGSGVVTPGWVGPRNWLQLSRCSVARLDLVGRALVHERGQPQHVADVVERVRGERLPVEEVPDRLHAGEAGAAEVVCVLSPAGGPLAAARLSGSTARLRSSIVWRSWRSGLANPGASFASRRSSRTSSVVLRTARRPDHGRLAERLERGQALCRERPQPGQEGVELVGRRTRGRAAPASAPRVRSPSRPM